jgi:tetratricopeptide (TPR) repeat protein
MPKRRVKQVIWEVESERLAVTPAMNRRIQKSRLLRATSSLSALKEAKAEEDVFYVLAPAAFGAYDLGSFDEADVIARRMLEIAPSFQDSWNYGNTMFCAHTVLGLLAVRRGDLDQAIQALYASAENPGSPQLASFGPTMRLAKELVELGKREEVILFLRQCLTFWKMGEVWVEVWEKKIRRGSVPNFLMNLHT